MPITVNTSVPYSVKVLETLLVQATTGNELVEGGHICVVPDVVGEMYLPMIRAGKMLRKVVEQPEDKDAKGTFDITDKKLKPEEFMAFTTFNPKSFEKLWRKYQPTGPLVFAKLPPAAQNKLLMTLAQAVDFELGGHYVNGEFVDDATEDDKLFNGILYRAANDPKTKKMDAVELTKGNIIAKFGEGRTEVRKPIRNHKKLKLFVSQEDFDKYDDALTDLQVKGTDVTELSKRKFKGIPIVVLAALPENTFFYTIGSAKEDSNMWAGVAFSSDSDIIQIDKLTNAGERYFFKMKLKADTQIAFGEDFVLHQYEEVVVE